MGKHTKQIEKELEELRQKSNNKAKKLDNMLTSHILVSIEKLYLVNSEKNIETAMRFLIGTFNSKQLEGFSQMMVQKYMKMYIEHFDSIKKSSILWKKIND